MTYTVTIDGKTRGYIEVEDNESQESIETSAFSEVVRFLGERMLDKIVVVPNKLINIVTKE